MASRQHPDARRPTRDIDPTQLSFEAEIAEGTPPPTSIAALQTQRLPVTYEPPPRESFESIAVDRPSIGSLVRETLELPIGELSLDQTEVQPLEEIRAQRAFLRIDTSDPAPPMSMRLQPTRKSTQRAIAGTAIVQQRIPWLAYGIALFVSAAVTALLFAR